MNQKPGLTDSVSCPTMEIPGRQITDIKIRNTVNHNISTALDLNIVCLSCGLESLSTVNVMSGRCLHFMGLVPKLGRDVIQNVLQI